MGLVLEEGKARELFERFMEFKTTLPEEVHSLIPDVVCFSVSELQNYLTEVAAMLAEKGTPENERYIAIMPGKNDEDALPHQQEKVTFMFVASRAIDNDEGGVAAIENCVMAYGEFPEPGEGPDDLSYDGGSSGP